MPSSGWPASGQPAPTTRECGARAERGWQVYAANADAVCARSIAAAFPTVAALVGEEDFARFIRRFRRDHPPARGDLGEWGGALPDWLAACAPLKEWPYLADCARLDWAMHCCERSIDDAFDAASLSHLGDADPAWLQVDFAAGVQLVHSPWPIHLIHVAHRGGGGDGGSDAAISAARDAIIERRSECVLVARDGWKAQVTLVDDASAAFTRALLGGRTLAEALDVAPAGFDFARWLADAVRGRWLKGIRVPAD